MRATHVASNPFSLARLASAAGSHRRTRIHNFPPWASSVPQIPAQFVEPCTRPADGLLMRPLLERNGAAWLPAQDFLQKVAGWRSKENGGHAIVGWSVY